MHDPYPYIGTYTFNNEPVGIPGDSRFEHVYVIGKPGMGKSTLLENLAIQDIHNGEGVTFLDPHGTSAERILEHIPPHRTGHVAYIKPSDYHFPVALNLVDAVADDALRFTHVSMIVAAFRNLFGDSWGPRLQQILHACLAALTEVPNTSVLSVPEMLVNPGYRDWVARHAKDPMTRHFFDKQLKLFGKDFEREATPAVQNKLYQFLANPLIRNILGQVKSSIDIDFLINNRRILIVNLAKQAIGEIEANLLGSLIVSLIQSAAMRRLSSLDTLVPHYGYIDEFHNFTTEASVTLLPEVRKAELGLTLAHQFTGQLSRPIRDAVFGSVGTICAFQVGVEDATLLERQYGTINEKHFGTRRDFLSLPSYQACLNWGMNEGVMVTTYPPIGELVPSCRYDRKEVIIAESRRRFGRPRARVEERIGRFLARPVVITARRRMEKEGKYKICPSEGRRAVRHTSKVSGQQRYHHSLNKVW